MGYVKDWSSIFNELFGGMFFEAEMKFLTDEDFVLNNYVEEKEGFIEQNMLMDFRGDVQEEAGRIYEDRAGNNFLREHAQKDRKSTDELTDMERSSVQAYFKRMNQIGERYEKYFTEAEKTVLQIALFENGMNALSDDAFDKEELWKECLEIYEKIEPDSYVKTSEKITESKFDFFEGFGDENEKNKELLKKENEYAAGVKTENYFEKWFSETKTFGKEFYGEGIYGKEDAEGLSFVKKNTEQLKRTGNKKEMLLDGVRQRLGMSPPEVKIEMVNNNSINREVDIDETIDLLSERLREMMIRGADGFYL